MKPANKHGGPLNAWQRLRHSERGQGLVEYALIIVVVSLGTIAALTFLRDNIRGLFSAAGSSIALGADGTGGTGTGGTGGNTLPATSTTVPSTNTTDNPSGGGSGYYSPTGNTSGGGGGYTGIAGVYTDNQPNGITTGASCSGMTVGTGTTPSGWVWVYHGAFSGSAPEWAVTGATGTPFQWVCANRADFLWVDSTVLANNGTTSPWTTPTRSRSRSRRRSTRPRCARVGHGSSRTLNVTIDDNGDVITFSNVSSGCGTSESWFD